MRELRRRHGRSRHAGYEDPFTLGVVERGGLTIFTRMGAFRTRDAAVAYYESKPRSGSRHNIVTVETIPDVAHGRVYGHHYVVRTLDGTAVKGAW